jgi:quinol monooxygenase YgiN
MSFQTFASAAHHPSRPRSGDPVLRVDKFLVPRVVLDEFMVQIQRIDRAVAIQPGCLRHQVLMQIEEPGGADVAVMTIVEWADAAALHAAKALMQQRYAQEGFKPAAFMQALGVRADMGSYGVVA